MWRRRRRWRRSRERIWFSLFGLDAPGPRISLIPENTPIMINPLFFPCPFHYVIFPWTYIFGLCGREAFQMAHPDLSEPVISISAIPIIKEWPPVSYDWFAASSAFLLLVDRVTTKVRRNFRTPFFISKSEVAHRPFKLLGFICYSCIRLHMC